MGDMDSRDIVREVPNIMKRNKINKTFEPVVVTSPAEWPGRSVDLGSPLDEGDGSAMLPDKHDASFVDALLHRLYSGEGTMTVLDMSESNFTDNQIPRFADALGESTSIKVLSLRANRLTGASMQDLAYGIRKNKSLTAIDLSQNSIGAKGAAELAKVLRDKPGITALDLSCCLLNDKGALDILEAVCSVPNFPIRRVSLSENQISDHTSAGLSTLLDEAKQLEFLDISRCSFHAGGIKLLSDEIVVHLSLRHLSLAHVHLSSEAMEPFAASIRRNVSIHTLDLYGCFIGDKGASYMARALADNHALQRLDLGTNGIHIVGCESIADALTANSTLTSLKLWGNELREGVVRLQNAMLRNDRITELDLTGSMGPEHVLQTIKALVRKNHNVARIQRAQLQSIADLTEEVQRLKKELKGNGLDILGLFNPVGRMLHVDDMKTMLQGSPSEAVAKDSAHQAQQAGASSHAGGAPPLNPDTSFLPPLAPRFHPGAVDAGEVDNFGFEGVKINDSDPGGDWWKNLTSSVEQLPATLSPFTFGEATKATKAS